MTQLPLNFLIVIIKNEGMSSVTFGGSIFEDAISHSFIVFASSLDVTKCKNNETHKFKLLPRALKCPVNASTNLCNNIDDSFLIGSN